MAPASKPSCRLRDRFVLPLAAREFTNARRTVSVSPSSGGRAVSRAINADASEEQLTTLCTKFGLGISVIEQLHSGGTRIVLNNIADADVLRTKLGKLVINGQVQRSGSHVGRQPVR